MEAPAHDRMLELFTEATRKIVVGDPADEKTEMGSLVSERQRERVSGYVEIGRDEGADLVYGGEPPTGDPFDAGAYWMPPSSMHVAPTCASSARRSSDRWWRSSRSTTRQMPFG